MMNKNKRIEKLKDHFISVCGNSDPVGVYANEAYHFLGVEKMEELLFAIGEQLGYPYGEIDNSIPMDKAIANLQIELAALKAWKEEQLTVEASWDVQEIGV